MNMKRTELVVGQTYKNKNGETYKCLSNPKRNSYVVQSLISGWTCTVHGIWMLDSGEIVWDCSDANGEFLEIAI